MNRKQRFYIWVSSFALLGILASVPCFGQTDLPSEVLGFADKVLYNGKILTADDKFAIAQAVAIRDGKIMAVGDSDRVLKMAGPKTERVDLKGRTVTPGFIEVHGEAFEGGHGGSKLAYTAINIRFASLDEGLRDMREKVDKQGKPDQVLFFTTTGAGEKNFAELDRKLLDGIAPNVPVAMIYMTSGVVNSAALKLLPAELAAGPGVEKDAQGQPTGHVFMPVLGYLTYDLLPWPDAQKMEKMVEEQVALFQRVNGIGITSVGGRAHGLAVTVVHEVWQRGLKKDPNNPLPVRVRFSSEIVRMNPYAEGALKRIGNISGIGDEWFRLYGANLYAVGWVGEDMPTLKPKFAELGNHGTFGANAWKFGLGENWKEVNGSDYRGLILANRYGWPVMDFHVQGDGEVQTTLEAFEDADKERPLAGRRFGFVHGLQRTPEQIQRMAKFDPILSLTPRYLFYDTLGVERMRKLYGADALHGFTPIKNIIKSGMKPILESNYSYRDASNPNMTDPGLMTRPNANLKFTYWWLVEKLITRKQEGTGIVWGADQRVTRQEALWMGTNWAARFYEDEKVMGTLEPGKVADLLILGADYMTVPEDQISEIPILQTVVGGKVTYENPANKDKLLSR